MPCTNTAKAFAEQAKRRDWNAVLAAPLFGERGLEALQALLDAHGLDAVDLAVRDLLAKSKADRAIPRNYVKSWAYFRPYINEQLERLA